MPVRWLLTAVVLGSLSCAPGQENAAPIDSESAEGEIPSWVVYPDEEWRTLTVEEAFPDDSPPGYYLGGPATRVRNLWTNWVAEKLKNLQGAAWEGEDHSGNQWGVAIAWGGYLLQTFGDPDYRFQTASLGKAFTLACLQLAVDEGLIAGPEALIHEHWTGEGQLNAPAKHMNQGHHTRLSFLHLARHTGGFAVTNGYSWQNCKNYDNAAPSWASCSTDPDQDNYSQAEPGTHEKHYSSGGYWRLSQALTALWKKDLKQVMDEKLFSQMGIPADRWDWVSGRQVRENTSWYPNMPGYGLYLDPPYEIDGQVVRGGPGWVVMSAKDLARVGLLVATRGVWKGERLISDTELLRGHGGGNGSYMGGIGEGVMLSFGRVATEDLGGTPLTNSSRRGYSVGRNLIDIPLQLFLNRRPKPASAGD